MIRRLHWIIAARCRVPPTSLSPSLRPGLALNEILLGALARAQQLYPLRICAFVFLSSHLHLILEVDDAQRLACSMNHFNSKIAREVGRLIG
jgi:hypothetical protein